LTVIVSIFYYLKIIVCVCMRPAEVEVVLCHPDIPGRIAVVLALPLGLGIVPGSLLGLITRLVSSVQMLV
jgi:NADH:ubiquinone oxidoreductase subunit 2 (subunit N)